VAGSCEYCDKTLTGRQSVRFCDPGCYRAWQADRAATGSVARFWAKVKKTPSGCWLWTASTSRGYGQFNVAGIGRIYAHRYAWVLTNGPILDNLSVLHRCDTPICCNPNHLFLGTQQENLNDARQKGRLVDGRHLIKLSDADLLDIRLNYRPRVNGKALAAKYGISLVHLLRVVNGTARVRRPLQLERVPFRQLEVRGEVG
jgi:hypothetical protein